MQRRFIIVSGLSGAGKTIALHALEDAGYYCVDNLPVSLLAEFADYTCSADLLHYEKVAVGIDVRNPQSDLDRLPRIMDQLCEGDRLVELLFIDAADQALINRFNETRRRHPLSNESTPLYEAIANERALLEPIFSRADLRIDTTNTHVHDLRVTLHAHVVPHEAETLSLQITSFGFKNGIPPDADFLFDVRCLPNPHWDPALREQSGRDDAVREFLAAAPVVAEMIDDIVLLLAKWIPRYEAEDRSYLTIAIGCTGGRHRSVYVAEQTAAQLRVDRAVIVSHRDS